VKQHSKYVQNNFDDQGTVGYEGPFIQEHASNEYPFIDSTGGDELYVASIVDSSINDIIKEAVANLEQIENAEMKELILMIFGKLSMKIRLSELTSKTHYLPPIRLFKMEDESILIEWMFHNFRIGFSVEEDINESSWYFISNKNMEDQGQAGFVREVDIDILLDKFVTYIAINT
jgi:hypothetical protein